MTPFEEIFRTRAQDTEADKILRQKLQEAQARRGTSLIDTNRARNPTTPFFKVYNVVKDVLAFYDVTRRKTVLVFAFGEFDSRMPFDYELEVSQQHWRQIAETIKNMSKQTSRKSLSLRNRIFRQSQSLE